MTDSYPIPVVGLTGGIGSGKSFVARGLRELGAVVIDADIVAREVVAPGQPALQEIVTEFGPAVLGPAGALDRAALGALVFGDPERRAALERIVHPAIAASVRASVAAAAAAGARWVVYEAALLVESEQKHELACLVVVSAPRAVQVERVMARDGLERAAVEQRLAAQLPLEEKIAVADHVIDNGGDREATNVQIQQLFAGLDATFGGEAELR